MFFYFTCARTSNLVIILGLNMLCVRHGSGSIMMFEGFSSSERDKLVGIDRLMDGAKNMAILKENFCKVLKHRVLLCMQEWQYF